MTDSIDAYFGKNYDSNGDGFYKKQEFIEKLLEEARAASQNDKNKLATFIKGKGFPGALHAALSANCKVLTEKPTGGASSFSYSSLDGLKEMGAGFSGADIECREKNYEFLAREKVIDPTKINPDYLTRLAEGMYISAINSVAVLDKGFIPSITEQDRQKILKKNPTASETMIVYMYKTGYIQEHGMTQSQFDFAFNTPIK